MKSLGSQMATPKRDIVLYRFIYEKTSKIFFSGTICLSALIFGIEHPMDKELQDN